MSPALARAVRQPLGPDFDVIPARDRWHGASGWIVTHLDSRLMIWTSCGLTLCEAADKIRAELHAQRNVTDRIEVVAAAIWPWVRCGMKGCERMSWADVNRGSLAHELTCDAARAAIGAAS